MGASCSATRGDTTVALEAISLHTDAPVDVTAALEHSSAVRLQAVARGWLQRRQTIRTHRILVGGDTPPPLRPFGRTAFSSDPPARLKLRTPVVSVLHEAAKRGDLVRLAALLDEGNSVDGIRFGFAPLHIAAKAGQADAVALLLDRGADVNARATNGESALHGAAENNRTRVIAQLLARGAELHARANGGETALHAAAVGGWMRATRLLVSRGSDVLATNELGDSACDVAKTSGYGRCTCTDKAAREWAQVASFLERAAAMAGGDERAAFARREHERAVAPTLHDAAEAGNAAQLGSLLKQRVVDVDAKDVDGSTALHAAVEGGALAAASLLVAWRADTRATNNYGDTPLHAAATLGSLKLSRLLLANGAEARAKNRFGATALDQARRHQSGGEWAALEALLLKAAAAASGGGDGDGAQPQPQGLVQATPGGGVDGVKGG